jgi:histidine ammonia-lyase/phenylalanine ammonia-lyase
LKFTFDLDNLSVETVSAYVFQRRAYDGFEISTGARSRIEHTHQKFLEHLEYNNPIYGVTTGFGSNCQQVVPKDRSEELQSNLVSYLLCGTGRMLSKEASRAMSLIRIKSLSRGFSGVSVALLEHMCDLLARDILPEVPVEGSLGASGDLIPLAYLGQLVQGKGMALTPDGRMPAEEAFKKYKIKPYKLKPKEGLAIVNGTSTMAAQALVNYTETRYLADVLTTATAWLCMVLQGKAEAFGPLVNEKAKLHAGQARVASEIRTMLEDESYKSITANQVRIRDLQTAEMIQDRYSLRCTPQVLGPVVDTVSMFEQWLEHEINSTSDNPLIDPDSGELSSGGNFYGGYLAHGMDYFKICLGNMADLLDRQLTTVMDARTSNGLPPNLANWPEMNDVERHLHHGLKGLHQATNAITSEIMAMVTPNTIFSRSSETHNQDKVSLGMSAAISCADMLQKMFTVTSMHLICLTQAIELRGYKLRGAKTAALFDFVRQHVPFVRHDQPLGERILVLSEALRVQAHRKGLL